MKLVYERCMECVFGILSQLVTKILMFLWKFTTLTPSSLRLCPTFHVTRGEETLKELSTPILCRSSPGVPSLQNPWANRKPAAPPQGKPSFFLSQNQNPWSNRNPAAPRQGKTSFFSIRDFEIWYKQKKSPFAFGSYFSSIGSSCWNSNASFINYELFYDFQLLKLPVTL